MKAIANAACAPVSDHCGECIVECGGIYPEFHGAATGEIVGRVGGYNNLIINAVEDKGVIAELDRRGYPGARCGGAVADDDAVLAGAGEGAVCHEGAGAC